MKTTEIIIKLKSNVYLISIKNWILLKDASSIVSLFFILVYFLFPVYSPYIIKHYSEINEKRLSTIASGIAGNYSSKEEAVKKIMSWEKKIMVGVWGSNSFCGFFGSNNLCLVISPPYLCVRLVSHENPSWIITSRCGACEEHALLFAELANSINITTRSIHNHGEDHNWDEVWINDSWIAVNPSDNAYDVNLSQFGVGRKLNISYVFAIYPNGTEEDVTDRYNDTKINKLTIFIKEQHDSTKNVSVAVVSYSYKKDDLIANTCTVKPNEKCVFKLGVANYRIVAVKDGFLKFSDTKNIFLDKDTEMILQPDNLDIIASIPYYLVYLITAILFWILVGECVILLKSTIGIKKNDF